MFIDSHTHLDVPNYDADRAEVIDRSRQAGVEMIDEFAEYKYLIEGETTEPDEFIQVVAKLGPHNTVVITVYRVI
jgi:Tat protein secretion system quality control protein TatD with DNase activity